MPQQAHRPGAFKQPNKKHKSEAKSSRNDKSGGRQAPKAASHKQHKRNLDRQQRRNQLNVQRKAKRETVLNQKRSRGTDSTPPFLVAIIPLCGSVNSKDVLESLKSAPDTTVTENAKVCHINSTRLKQRFAFVRPSKEDLYAILDAAKVADTVLFCLSIEESMEYYAEQILSCIIAQGLPSVTFCVPGLKSLPIKKQNEVKKDIIQRLEKKLPEPKIHSLNDGQDAHLLLHTIGSHKMAKMRMREYRPHLMGNEVEFEPQADDSSVGTLKVTGYLRGHSLGVNDAVHIPGFGDFQLLQIDAIPDPQRLAHSKPMDGVVVLETADVANREPLQALVPFDEMAQEQTWPTEEELMEAEQESARKNKKKVKKRLMKKGVSEYQAVWMDDEGSKTGSEDDDDDEDDEEEEDDEDESDDEEEEDEMEIKYDANMEDAFASNDKSSKEDFESADYNEDDDDIDNMSLGPSEGERRVRFADDADTEAEKRAIEEENDRKYPDEVDAPIDLPAKIRFQKYRGLASFQKSPWLYADQDQPSDYERIAIIENFNSIRTAVLKSLKKPDEKKQCLPGRYITIHIDKVPADVMKEYNHSHPLVIFGLLKGEHYVSVVNFFINRCDESEEIIRSKDPMIFQVGYRRFSANPIFSQHTHGDKHKMEKFLRLGTPLVATVYAPLIFAPASVLMFKKLPNGEEKLVAHGRVLSVDPNRLIIKRIMLTGHLFKTSKNSAVVRRMFHSPDDILWFKPVELLTKSNMRGNINEPIGTHGRMKCVFEGTLKSHDSVYLRLYKRVFPKLTYNARVPFPCSSYIDEELSDNEDAGHMEIFD